MQGVDAALILDLVPDHAAQRILDLAAVAIAAGLVGGRAVGGLGLVAGAEVVGGTAAQGQRALHRAGEAAEGQPGLLGLGPGRLHRSLVGLGLSGAGLRCNGAGAFGLGQLHGDLGQAREHLDLLQREAAAVGLNVEICWCGLHRTYHEPDREERAMNIAFTTDPRAGAGGGKLDRHATCGLAMTAGEAEGEERARNPRREPGAAGPRRPGHLWIGEVSTVSSVSTTKTASSRAGSVVLALALTAWRSPGISEKFSPAL